MSARRLGFLALACLLGAAGGVSQALADCGADIGPLMQQRAAQMKSINEMVVAQKGKQIDPTLFCAKSRPLIEIENRLIAYMKKNQDWCSIPAEMISQLEAAHSKSASFSARACQAAVAFKKMKEQAQNGGAPTAPQLPTGPL